MKLSTKSVVTTRTPKQVRFFDHGTAVECAHSNRIIHLDLKPANVLLLEENKPDDFVKVIDFGLSRLISKESGTTLTQFVARISLALPSNSAAR